MNCEKVSSRGYRCKDFQKRIGSGRKRNENFLTEKNKTAVKEAKELLSDGQWHYTKEVYDIAAKHKVIKGNLLYQLPLALSDDKLYFCLPDERTPDEPKDRVNM